jgi:DNA-binding IscR family transcriptional regulator
MPRISNTKKEKISEQILHHLFSQSPNPIFTSQIAEEIARDEEFTLSILKELKTKGLVLQVNKNTQGKEYIRRKRWLLSNQTYNAYSQHQR